MYHFMKLKSFVGRFLTSNTLFSNLHYVAPFITESLFSLTKESSGKMDFDVF